MRAYASLVAGTLQYQQHQHLQRHVQRHSSKACRLCSKICVSSFLEGDDHFPSEIAGELDPALDISKGVL